MHTRFLVRRAGRLDLRRSVFASPGIEVTAQRAQVQGAGGGKQPAVRRSSSVRGTSTSARHCRQTSRAKPWAGTPQARYRVKSRPTKRGSPECGGGVSCGGRRVRRLTRCWKKGRACPIASSGPRVTAELPRRLSSGAGYSAARSRPRKECRVLPLCRSASDGACSCRTGLDEPDGIWTGRHSSGGPVETVAPGVTGSSPVGRPNVPAGWPRSIRLIGVD
jgi:hypothetical protein